VSADEPERVPDALTIVPAGYAEWLADVKARVRAAQQCAAMPGRARLGAALRPPQWRQVLRLAARP
jgi:hypothetical protein